MQLDIQCRKFNGYFLTSLLEFDLAQELQSLGHRGRNKSEPPELETVPSETPSVAGAASWLPGIPPVENREFANGYERAVIYRIHAHCSVQ